MRTLVWMSLLTGCLDGVERPDKLDETGDSGETGHTDEVDTGGCPADVDAAIVALNEPDQGYDTAGEQIFTEFTCDVQCKPSSDAETCLVSPAHCADDGDPTAEWPFDEALTVDTGSLDGYIEASAQQSLAAKLGLVDVKDGLTCAGGNGDRLDEIVRWYDTNPAMPMACADPGAPPPPTGACPSITSCDDWVEVAGSFFRLTIDPALAEGRLNLAQKAINPAATGCWVRAIPVEGNHIWLAALYGIANFGTSAIVQFAPCGSTSDADLQVLNVHEITMSLNGDLASFLLWFDEPDSILAGSPPGGAITVEGMKFSQGPRRYKWTGAAGFYEKIGGSWVALGSGVNPAGWPSCTSGPFNVGATRTGPFAIIDPADEDQATALDVAARTYAENLTFATP